MLVINQECGLKTKYTNHSLRATAATCTCMFKAGVLEKVNQPKT